MNINNPTTFSTPDLTLSTTNSSGVAGALRADDTILVYDATVPTTIAYGASASAGDTATAARRNHSHGMAAGSVLVGSYTGNGATSQVISGLGVTPKSVLITAADVVGNAAFQFYTTTQMLARDADGLAVKSTPSAQSFVENAIIALSSGSFTVDDAGADSDPNKNSQAYDYIVWS